MQINPYTEDNLAESLKNDFTSTDVIKEKDHFLYLTDYLGTDGLRAKTIVIEEGYISKDFLQDYASYYSLCFTDYDKICKRVHFFNADITEAEFKAEILRGSSDSAFWKQYLGFVVVKPIPLTVIGYTVLKTYEGETRFFWGTRHYKVHVFGCEVPLIKSLAFQEQDSVLAACATTAIWSMLNKASADFHTVLKSPSEITRDADNMRFDGTRLFPNTGLNISQICQAIENSGLVTENKQPRFPFTNLYNKEDMCIPNKYLKKIINAYAPIGIPIILVISVPCEDYYGLHAVAVSGHSIKPITARDPKTEISFRAEDIEKLYAHDDQWGPFAKIEFQDEHLVTTWTKFHHGKFPTILKNIIISLYPKIRISYSDISDLVTGFDGILANHFDGEVVADLVWDIKIHFSEDYKCLLRQSTLPDDIKLKRLFASMPKYIWMASCHIGDIKILDITFDATNVSNGMIMNDVVNYLEVDDTKRLIEFLEYNEPHFDLVDFLKHRLASSYYKFFLKRLKGEED